MQQSGLLTPWSFNQKRVLAQAAYRQYIIFRTEKTSVRLNNIHISWKSYHNSYLQLYVLLNRLGSLRWAFRLGLRSNFLNVTTALVWVIGASGENHNTYSPFSARVRKIRLGRILPVQYPVLWYSSGWIYWLSCSSPCSPFHMVSGSPYNVFPVELDGRERLGISKAWDLRLVFTAWKSINRRYWLRWGDVGRRVHAETAVVNAL